MTAWMVILAVGLGTYGLRATMFAFVATRPLPSRLGRALGFVGPAAIAALVATLTLTRSGTVEPAAAAQLLAIGAGFGAVRRSQSKVDLWAVLFLDYLSTSPP